MQMQLLRVTDFGGTVSVGDIVVAVEPVKAVVSHPLSVRVSACCRICNVICCIFLMRAKYAVPVLSDSIVDAGREDHVVL